MNAKRVAVRSSAGLDLFAWQLLIAIPTEYEDAATWRGRCPRQLPTADPSTAEVAVLMIPSLRFALEQMFAALHVMKGNLCGVAALDREPSLLVRAIQHCLDFGRRLHTSRDEHSRSIGTGKNVFAQR